MRKNKYDGLYQPDMFFTAFATVVKLVSVYNINMKHVKIVFEFLNKKIYFYPKESRRGLPLSNYSENFSISPSPRKQLRHCSFAS